MSDRRQGGYALLGFALLTLPLLAFAALVIDLGVGDSAQGRLETAAEVAALEGPRGWRGNPTDLAWCENDPNPSCDPSAVFDAWDAARRARASLRVGALFAAGDAATARVGPIATAALALDPSGLGLGDPSLSTQITAPAATGAGPPVGPGDPRLEFPDPLAPNLFDEARGDLVGGTFTGPTRARVTSCVDPARLETFGENCNYERADFTPGVDAPPNRRAFLARLRLTGEAPEAGISAPDGTLAVLFGRLTDEGLRQRGLAVRATAIADARPALAVGRPDPVVGPGAAAVAFDVGAWQGLSTDTATTLSLVGSTIFAPDGTTVVGRVLAGAPRAVFAGEEVEEGGALLDAAGEAFVPLYRAVVGAVRERVVAFGRAEIIATAGATTFTLQRRTSAVAPANASAVITLGLATLSDDAVRDLFFEYRNATCAPETDELGLVCAPVVVR